MMRSISAAGFLLLSGCYVVGDGTYFKPQRPPTQAATAADLRVENEAQFAQPAAPGTPLDGRLPARLRHEFVQLGRERIAYTYVTPTNSNARDPLILLCGGNATTRYFGAVRNTAKLLPWGEVVLFDYPGYGDSSGAPTAAGILPEMKFVAQHIDAMAKGRTLVLWGHSIGGLMCAEVARHSREADAFVIETSAPNARAMVDEIRPGWASWVNITVGGDMKDFDAPTALKDFKAPILVLGATKDETLPIALARQYAERLRADGHDLTWKEYPEAMHHTVTAQPAFPADMRSFLAKVSDTRR